MAKSPFSNIFQVKGGKLVEAVQSDPNLFGGRTTLTELDPTQFKARTQMSVEEALKAGELLEIDPSKIQVGRSDPLSQKFGGSIFETGQIGRSLGAAIIPNLETGLAFGFSEEQLRGLAGGQGVVQSTTMERQGERVDEQGRIVNIKTGQVLPTLAEKQAQQSAAQQAATQAPLQEGGIQDATLTGMQDGGRFGNRSFGRVGNDVFEIMPDGTRRAVSQQEFETDLKQQGLNLDVLPQLGAPDSTGADVTGTQVGVDGQSPLATGAMLGAGIGMQAGQQMATSPTEPGAGGPPVVYTPPQGSNGNNAYYKQWNPESQNWDVFDATGNPVSLDQFKALGLNIDHLNTQDLLEPENQAANMLTTYGSSQTPDSYRQDPLAAFESSYEEITTNMGLDGIKGMLENMISELNDIDNKMAEEISVVNDNPWLSEALRSKKIKNIQNKFESKRAAKVEELQLLQGLYDRGRDDAKFIATNALKQFNKDREFAQDQLEFRLERADAMREASKRDTAITTGQGGRRLLIDKQTGEVIADLGASSSPKGTGPGDGVPTPLPSDGNKLSFEEWKQRYFPNVLSRIESGNMDEGTIERQNNIFTQAYQQYLNDVPGAAGVGERVNRKPLSSFPITTKAGVQQAISAGYDPADIRVYLDANTKLTTGTINSLVGEEDGRSGILNQIP